MIETEETKEHISSEIAEIIARLRPIDDILMREMFRDDIPFTQFVLRILTGIKDLIIIENVTQYDMSNSLAGSRSLRLDLLATDSKGRRINLEVQRADAGATPQRARYHSSAMDVECLKAGEDFSKLPITYTIFVTENDVFKKDKALYCFENWDRLTNTALDDGTHIIFANAAYDNENDNSDIAKLLHDFRCANPDDMKLEAMTNRTKNFKSSDKGGQLNMCKIMEDYKELCENRGREEGREEGRNQATVELALQLLQMGLGTKEQIATATKLSIEEIEELEIQLKGVNA